VPVSAAPFLGGNNAATVSEDKPTNVEFPCSFVRRHDNWTSLYYPDDQNMKKKQAGLENLSVGMRTIWNGSCRNVMGGCTLDSLFTVVKLVMNFQFP